MVFDGRPVAGSVFGENDRARAGGYQVAERHNNTQKLMYDTSLLVFQSEIPDQVYKEPEYGLNLYPLAEAWYMPRRDISRWRGSRPVPAWP